jgi:hypothetical protein
MFTKHLAMKIFFSLVFIFLTSAAKAGVPVWTFTPLTATTITVPSDSSAIVQYQVTNQSTRQHVLVMQAMTGITQLTTGLSVCGNSFVLAGHASCILSLQVNGSQLAQPISDGPAVCEQESGLECYRPSSDNILHITQGPPSANATITVTNSPLTLTVNGPTSTLTISNTSLIVTATSIRSNFTGTALDGNVSETGNTCANLPPQNSCTLTYTPGSTVVSQTIFPIQGSNTNIITAAIQVDSGITLTSVNPPSGSASGGTGVTLTGTGLTDTTAVTFGGTNATSINVVNSTTVTAVTPANGTGSVDVAITTPSGSATLINGYSYLTTAIGQPAFGGTIACLNGGLNNLIAASADNSTGIRWGSPSITTGAISTTDGASNTSIIVNTAGESTPNSATICDTYEVDSQGNTPCELGNTCYSDWFLPAGINSTSTGQMNCLFNNESTIGGFDTTILYWTSTESDVSDAYIQSFINGDQFTMVKNSLNHVRCVRAFSP